MRPLTASGGGLPSNDGLSAWPNMESARQLGSAAQGAPQITGPELGQLLALRKMPPVIDHVQLSPFEYRSQTGAGPPAAVPAAHTRCTDHGPTRCSRPHGRFRASTRTHLVMSDIRPSNVRRLILMTFAKRSNISAYRRVRAMVPALVITISRTNWDFTHASTRPTRSTRGSMPGCWS